MGREGGRNKGEEAGGWGGGWLASGSWERDGIRTIDDDDNASKHTSAYPYLATISSGGARDSKWLIVIVKRAARIPVISYFLSS